MKIAHCFAVALAFVCFQAEPSKCVGDGNSLRSKVLRGITVTSTERIGDRVGFDVLRKSWYEEFMTWLSKIFRFEAPTGTAGSLRFNVDSPMGQSILSLQKPAVQDALMNLGSGAGNADQLWDAIEKAGGLQGLSASEQDMFEQLVEKKAQFAKQKAEQAKLDDIPKDAGDMAFEGSEFDGQEFDEGELKDLVNPGEGEEAVEALKALEEIK